MGVVNHTCSSFFNSSGLAHRMDPQCHDISTVLQTLYTLYSNTNTNFESRKVASTWLTQLQASVSHFMS